MSNTNGFVIENGVLKEYKGKDKNEVIPDSVTSIGWRAFACCPKLTVYAPAGSYAARYAKENKISFEAE